MTTEATEFIYTRPTLYPQQEAAIFTPARYSLIEASTKSGKTHGCLAWLFEQAAVQGGPGRHYWWIAPVLAQARIAYRRMKDGLPRGIARASETDPSILLPNGATIWFRSGEHPDSLYGEDVWAAVIDEATRVKPEAWHALRSTLTATQGPVRIIGNVAGRRNWAYQLARRAEAGESDMHYAKITAYDAIKAGVLAQEEVEDARRNLSERVFRELYLAEPADSLTLIYSPFGPENVTEAAAYVRDAGEIYVGYDWGFTDPTHIGLYQYRDGALYQFDELVGSGRSEASWVAEIVARITALPGYDGPTLDGWRKLWSRGRDWPRPWLDTWPYASAGDPSAVQFRSELQERGMGGQAPENVRHAVTSGQDVLRSLILSGEDRRRFFIHPRCTRTVEAFKNYRATELAEGIYDPRPDPHPSNHTYSHGTDQARYLCWTLRTAFGLAGYEG